MPDESETDVARFEFRFAGLYLPMLAAVTPSEAEVRIHHDTIREVPYDEHWDLVINATSAGYKGETPPFPATVIGPDSFCYDLSYAAKPTPFCAWAKAHGAKRLAMGWGMLVEQAAESFHLWRGVRPDTKPVLKRISISA